MFKSFLPKICAIPAAAIPLALLNVFGHVAPVNGRIQLQPPAIATYCRVVTVVCIVYFTCIFYFTCIVYFACIVYFTCIVYLICIFFLHVLFIGHPHVGKFSRDLFQMEISVEK